MDLAGGERPKKGPLEGAKRILYHMISDVITSPIGRVSEGLRGKGRAIFTAVISTPSSRGPFIT